MAVSHVLILIYGLILTQGIPLKTEKTFLELIEDLRSNCSDNPFLDSEQYKLEGCEKANLQKHDKLTLNCLTVLDINRRLCKLKNGGSFDLKHLIKLEESKNISTDLVCNTESNITFDAVPESPKYEETMKNIFKKKACPMLCMSDDVLNYVEPNLFCKMLYYGTVIIREVQSEVDKANEIEPVKIEQNVIDGHNAVLEQSVTEKQTTNVSKTEKTQSETSLAPKVTSTTAVTSQIANDSNKAAQNVSAVLPKISTSKEVTGVKDMITATQEKNAIPKKDGDDTVDAVSTEEKPIEDFEYGMGGDNSFANDNSDNVDNQENQEEVPVFNRGPDPIKKEMVQADQIVGYEEAIEDIDDEGSFFPLFFFGVATMVLMYIIYHNKNKIMGLLIEGRHSTSSTRRRNSRGHAYRRLDTLEQAMSTREASVTPSKIIY